VAYQHWAYPDEDVSKMDSSIMMAVKLRAGQVSVSFSSAPAMVKLMLKPLELRLVRMLLMRLHCRWCRGSWRAGAASSPTVTASWIVCRREACCPRLVPLLACSSPPGTRCQPPAHLPRTRVPHRFQLLRADVLRVPNRRLVRKVPRKWLGGARFAAAPRLTSIQHPCWLFYSPPSTRFHLDMRSR